MAAPFSDTWRDFLASLPPELAALYKDLPEDVFDLGDGRSLTVAELFAVLSEQVATPPGTGQRTVRQDRRGAALLAGAWRHAAFGQARAVLALREAGLSCAVAMTSSLDPVRRGGSGRCCRSRHHGPGLGLSQALSRC